MPKEACLSAIRIAWPDITPVSIRAANQPTICGARLARNAEAGDGVWPHNMRYVQEFFELRASRQPDSVAVISAQAEITYRALNHSANQLAHYLQGCGVRPETVVGVFLERSIQAIRCLLAILKAGGAYLPMDPSLPDVRLEHMCEDAGVKFVLVDSSNAAAFPASSAKLILVDELAQEMAAQPATSPVAGLRPANLAYAIHTSGSTGRPKAVAVSHGSLACFCREVVREYDLGRRDRVAQFAALGFDTSLEQILATLLSGAVLLLSAVKTVSPTDLVRCLAAQRITVIDLTPAYWHQVLAVAQAGEEDFGSLRLMITGGDLANAADCRAALRRARGARLLNAYGLTETTITSALCDLSEEVLPPQAGTPVPVGKPLAHTQIFVLDENLDAVPPGITGEIYIGGCGVARGYVGRPELTAELFVPNPYSAVAGARMYRSGDLGRFRPDGSLEVVGRVDRQVKIGGFRVEPAEIESVLVTHPDIDEVAVITGETAGDKQITAYYKPRYRTGADDTPSAESLRSFVSTYLPDFMIPAVFVALQRMPRAPGGNVDRQALPRPVIAATGHASGTTYTLLQAGLSHLWSALLNVGQVGLDDDFYRLGGNSLLAAEMLARACVMFGIGADQLRPLTRCLLRHPNLRSFANAVQDARAGILATDGTDSRVDFTREAELNVPVRCGAGTPPDWKQPREILLTGVTGFFGVHMLRELLTATSARIHCLVRAHHAGHGLRRIVLTAERYQLGELALDRVVPLVGDLGQPELGLPKARFTELARITDIIYHAGAQVNFIYPYSELRAANVIGTRELIRLAGLCRGIPIHYVSTMAVLAGFGHMGVRAVTEETPLAHADHLCVGYIESKFIAEELLRNAARSGLPVAIYRPLDIVGDRTTGAWNTTTEMCALIRFITDTGIAPDIDLPLDFIPADVCAAAINCIASHVEATGRTYHLASPEYTLLGSLADRLRNFGYVIHELPYQDWLRELLRYTAAHPDHPMTPFIPLFVDRCGDPGMTVAEMYFAHTFPSYDRKNAEQALRGSGIVFPAVDENLLDIHIEYLVASGFLADPRTGSRGTPCLARRERCGPGTVRDDTPQL